MAALGCVRAIAAAFPGHKGLAQTSARRDHGDVSLWHRRASIQGMQIVGLKDRYRVGDRLQIVQQPRRAPAEALPETCFAHQPWQVGHMCGAGHYWPSYT